MFQVSPGLGMQGYSGCCAFSFRVKDARESVTCFCNVVGVEVEVAVLRAAVQAAVMVFAKW